MPPRAINCSIVSLAIVSALIAHTKYIVKIFFCVAVLRTIHLSAPVRPTGGDRQAMSADRQAAVPQIVIFVPIILTYKIKGLA